MALGVHCLNHNLQLIIQEAASVNFLISDALATVKSICNLIRSSPKRLAMFQAIQQQQGQTQTPLKPLCPTRWTCKAKAIQSVLDNYEELIEAFQAIVNKEGSGEGVKLTHGLLKNMFDFNVLFGLHVSKEVFSATELLATSLQRHDMSAGDAIQSKDVLKKCLQTMRENASTFFQQVERESKVFEVDPPVLPPWRKMPRRFDSGTDNNARFTSPQQFFTTQYVEVIDLIAIKLDERFQQDT